MAGLSETLELIFKGKDDVSQTIGKIETSLDKFGSAAGKVTAPLADITKGLALMEIGVAAVSAALVTKGVTAAGEFQTSFQFLTTLFETSSENVGRFRQDILDYAAGSTQSLDSITNALNTAIGSGVSYSDSLKLLAETEKLAVAQGGELDSTVGLLVGTLNGYGLSISEAGKLSDQFSVTIRDGKISISELAAQMANITPIAAAAGIGFDQIGAAVAVLTAQGFVAGPAITGIKQIIEGLIKPTSDAADFAQELGLSFGAQALQADGLQGVLQKVFAATGGNVDQIARLFTTTEGLGAALALGGKGAEGFSKELLAMKDAAGTTDAAFEKMGGTISGAATKLNNAIEVAFINFGTPLLDEFVSISDGLAKVFSQLGDQFKDAGIFRPLTQDLEAWGDSVSAVFAAIGKNLPAALAGIDIEPLLSALRESRRVIGDLFSTLTGGADLTTVEGLRAAIQTVIDGVGIAIDAFNTWYGTINQIFENFKNSIIGSYILSFFDNIPVSAKKSNAGLREAQQDFDQIFKDYLTSLKDMHDGADAAISGVVDLLGDVGNFKLKPPDVSQFRSEIESLSDVEFKLDGPQVDIGGFRASLLDIESVFSEGLFRLGKLDPVKVKLDAEEAKKKATEFGKELENILAGGKGDGQGYTVKLNVDEAGNAIPELSTNLDKFKLTVDGVNRTLVDTGQKIKVVKEVGDDGSITYRNLEQQFSKTGDAAGKMGDSAAKTAKDVLEATKAANDFQVKMEQIASNERIKLIEANVSLNVAKLEADTQRVQAAFESINETIRSSGDVLKTLYGEYASTSDRMKELNFEEWIADENARRDKALETQNELIEAQIEQVRARTNALERGDATITIQGDGLKPHLEAFMWEILRAIQVRASADMQDFLLGVT